jgi:thiamine biosynthesis lipoprotein
MATSGGRRTGKRTLRRVLADAREAARTPEPPRSAYYIKLSRAAMACQFEVFLHPHDRIFVPAVLQALDLLEDLEQQMSVYRSDSELSRLNRTAAAGPIEVEPRLYELLKLARNIGIETGGAFDITSGALIRCWGFLQRSGRVPDREALGAARAASGWHNVAFDDQRHALSFVRSGVELNLGAIGKGYALDRIAASLREAGLVNFLIHAGGSSIVGSGNSNAGSGWQVRLRDPAGSEGGLGCTRLVDESMSTSGVGQQWFIENGRRYGHILDPRTGWPAEHNSLCSVMAPEAARAEALSTAFLVMTEAEVRSYFEAQKRIGIILVGSQEAGTRAEPLVLRVVLERPQEVLV